jgi:hypothetical protein
MIPAPLLAIETQLRRAVEGQQFEETARLISQYCQSAEGHIKSLPARSTSGGEIATRVVDVLNWSNLMLLTARSSIADKLGPLPLISRYLSPEDRFRAHMRIEA